ncbi:type III polyketide synthase [Synechococcus sp. RSCCF101]|uniref:type III polyketide synthase n=1 Tax=Synechococcus sp. RSCCF101 TaxID=2511069 RepID=UPI00124689C5|nr:type III polyketide synthase [Synechococcus sp. RSCCF101]QEY31245.1 type III polyketide synthase [Synechococcus sp. RSCCF101]
MPLTLHGIGTAVPEQAVSAEESIALAERVNAERPEQAGLVRRIHQRSQVHRRGSVLLEGSGRQLPIQQRLPFYGEESPGTADRMRAFARHATPLALKACRAAFRDSGLRPESITHLVTVSCTGFEAPGVDLALIETLALSASVQRTHVGFMGCHGALNGLRVARAYAEADAGAVVLLCSVELCSLHLHYGWEPEKLVANALFADGAAAVVASASPPATGRSLVLRANGATVIPGSRNLMHWQIGDHGFSMGLSPRVPTVVAEALKPWLEGWLDTAALRVEAIRSWALHPGGPKILTACAEALKLSPAQLTASREVLHDHGNMSSATVLFILERLRRSAESGPCLALAFGPGLSAEAALLDLSD